MCKFETDKTTYSKCCLEQRMATAKISLHCFPKMIKMSKTDIIRSKEIPFLFKESQTKTKANNSSNSRGVHLFFYIANQLISNDKLLSNFLGSSLFH